MAGIAARLDRLERGLRTRIVHQRVGDCEMTTVRGDASTLNAVLVERVATLERRLADADRLAARRGAALAEMLARILPPSPQFPDDAPQLLASWADVTRWQAARDADPEAR